MHPDDRLMWHWAHKRKGFFVLNILLVDDHALFRVGIKLLLAELVQDVSCTEAADCASALRLPGSPRFDVVLLDLKLPGIDGIEALPALRERFEEAAIAVLSGEEDPATIRRAIDAGAAGYIPKTSSPAVMMAALRLILAGGTYLPPHMLSLSLPAASKASEAPKPAAENQLPRMTDRQLETLKLAMQGKPNKVIAREMAISEATVKAHLATAFRILGVKNRTEAVFVAARFGLPLPA